MTELSGEPARPAAGASVDPAVPPPAGAFEARPVPDASPEPGGMVRFAGVVLGLAGIWHAAAGLVALVDSAYYRTATVRLPVHVGYTTWGWVHLVIGVIAVLAGFGVLAGNRLACVVAVVLAVVSAVINLVFLKAAPFSSLVIIALDVFVIWGVTAQAPPPRPAR
jgi:hypothetical protein